MSLIVLDASVALAWLLPSQATAASARLLGSGDAHVFATPPAFEWEVLNILLAHLRSGKLEEASFHAAFDAFANLPVEPAEPTDPTALLDLARQERLSLFDASYLELAMQLDAVLASRDRGLLAACRRRKVQTLNL